MTQRISGGPLQTHAQLSSRVKSYVRDLILSGQVVPGSYLRLDRLASELGISATPVREAMTGLAAEGFVDLQPRRGFRVAPITRRDIEDVFRLQAHLAGALAGRAATAMSADVLAELKQIQGRLESAARKRDLGTVEQLNYEFHRTINLAAESPKLSLFLRQAVRYAPRHFYEDISGWREATPESHHHVLAALENHDPEAARQAMEKHILHAGEQLLEHLDRVGLFSRIGATPSGKPAAGVSK